MMTATRPTLERRETIVRVRSLNPNMINHFANQSHTWQHWKEIVKSREISGLNDQDRF